MSALDLILSRVCWRTADLVMDLTWTLLGLADNHSVGWGRSYWRHNPLNFQNQDWVEGEADE